MLQTENRGSLLSASLKKRLRPLLRDKVEGFVHAFVLRRAVHEIAACQPHEVPSRKALSALRTGWGNDAYSADLNYLEEVATMAVRTPGPVLECGTGVTTLILGLLAGRRGVEVCALEHDKEWYNVTANALRRHRIRGVQLYLAPLHDYGGFTWYSSPDGIPPFFSFIVCDGPPELTPGGRYGLLPVMHKRLTKGSVILLDDAGTKAGSEAISRWALEWGTVSELISTSSGRLARVRVERQ
jgi:hypothetical protein